MLVVAFAACGDDAPGGSDRAGAGPTNELPLWVPVPGVVPTSNGLHQWSISEDRVIAGQRMFLAGYPGPDGLPEGGFGPAEPYFIRTYVRGQGGIYQAGDTRFGMYDEPVLVVPDKVRVGMRWYGAPFGKRRFTFEVVERSEVASTEGIVWYIEITDDDRITRGSSLSEAYQAETSTLRSHPTSDAFTCGRWTSHDLALARVARADRARRMSDDTAGRADALRSAADHREARVLSRVDRELPRGLTPRHRCARRGRV